MGEQEEQATDKLADGTLDYKMVNAVKGHMKVCQNQIKVFIDPHTSLQYCARMSLNFCIIWLLIASLERMCLNFRSMSKAAAADLKVLKD